VTIFALAEAKHILGKRQWQLAKCERSIHMTQPWRATYLL